MLEAVSRFVRPLAYASVMSYWAHGAAKEVRLGSGLWEATQFNNRLQPFDLRLRNGQAEPELWWIENVYE